MKNKLLIFVSILIVVASFSCKRTAVEDPDMVGGPVGYHYIVEGSADPSVIYVDGNIHTSRITVKVTDYKGNPIAGRYIFMELRLPEDPWDALNQAMLYWGYFENGLPTIAKRTNGSGVITCTYYGPDKISNDTLGDGILIKATFADDNQSHLEAMPYDFIDIVFVRVNDEE